MLYQVIEVEEKATQTGKRLKQCTLKGEGQDHLEPRTTIWEDHPEYDKAIVGAKINGEMQKKDSGTPIPKYPGKNYVNRTLLPEGTPTGNAPSGNIESRVKSLEDWRKTFAGQEPTVQTEAPKEDINPDDIPFN